MIPNRTYTENIKDEFHPEICCSVSLSAQLSFICFSPNTCFTFHPFFTTQQPTTIMFCYKFFLPALCLASYLSGSMAFEPQNFPVTPVVHIVQFQFNESADDAAVRGVCGPSCPFAYCPMTEYFVRSWAD